LVYFSEPATEGAPIQVSPRGAAPSKVRTSASPDGSTRGGPTPS